jgi:hypothetical protein
MTRRSNWSMKMKSKALGNWRDNIIFKTQWIDDNMLEFFTQKYFTVNFEWDTLSHDNDLLSNTVDFILKFEK